MKKTKKKNAKVKIKNPINEYYYFLGVFPLFWILTLPATIAFSIKTGFSVLLLDFVVGMQILTILYVIYDVKAGGYSIKQVYKEHGIERKGLSHKIIPVQIIFYLLLDIVLITCMFIGLI